MELRLTGEFFVHLSLIAQKIHVNHSLVLVRQQAGVVGNAFPLKEQLRKKSDSWVTTFALPPSQTNAISDQCT